MKKFFLPMILAVGLGSSAQTVDDAELFLARGLYGSPRFVAMGGAFTALGNDQSSIRINPAAASVFRTDNLGFSLGFQNTKNEANLLNGGATESIFNLPFENIGYVKKWETGGYKNKNHWAFSVGYNRVADFQREYSVNSALPIDTFGEGSLANFYLRNTFDVADNQGFEFLFSDELADFGLIEELAATQAGVLVEDTLGIYGVAFGNEVSRENANLNYNRIEDGSMDEFHLSLGGQYEDKFFYGAALGFSFLNYSNEEFVTENNLPNTGQVPFDASSYTFRRFNQINASGINIKLGLIYKPLQFWRIGASYETPTWYGVEQLYEFDVSSTFANGDRLQSDLFSTDGYQYQFRTPAIYRMGTAFILGKSGLISFDYEYSDPSQAETYRNGRSFNISNESISSANESYSQFFTPHNTLKAGAEIRLGPLVSLRGGYNWTQSIYADPENTRTNQMTYSGGIGFQNKRFGVNLAYLYSQWNRDDVVHQYLGEDLSESQITRTRVVLGANFNF